MRLLADECVLRLEVEALRAGGCDVLWISEISPGIDDTEVLEKAQAEKRILVTADHDFGDLVFRREPKRRNTLRYSALRADRTKRRPGSGIAVVPIRFDRHDANCFRIIPRHDAARRRGRRPPGIGVQIVVGRTRAHPQCAHRGKGWN